VGWSVQDRLGELALPVLVISGDMDYTPPAHKEAYVRLIPGAELVVIEDSRHATPVDQPEAFNTAVCEFLRQQRR
jgi:3-oxoadipate enol-lactonase